MDRKVPFRWLVRLCRSSLRNLFRRFLIEKRAKGKTPKELANERAAADKAAKAMYEAANDEALYWQWATYYKRAARVHAAIAARLEAKATALLERGEA